MTAAHKAQNAQKGTETEAGKTVSALDALNAQGQERQSERLRWAQIHEEHAAELRRVMTNLSGDALRVTAQDALWHDQQAQRLRRLANGEEVTERLKDARAAEHDRDQ
jgi:hypothetical protein